MKSDGEAYGQEHGEYGGIVKTPSEKEAMVHGG